MGAAALPGGAGEDRRDRCPEAPVGVRGDELDAGQAARHEAAQEVQPERPVLGGADVDAQQLALAGGVDGGGDDHGHLDDAALLAHELGDRYDPIRGRFRLSHPPDSTSALHPLPREGLRSANHAPTAPSTHSGGGAGGVLPAVLVSPSRRRAPILTQDEIRRRYLDELPEWLERLRDAAVPYRCPWSRDIYCVHGDATARLGSAAAPSRVYAGVVGR